MKHEEIIKHINNLMKDMFESKTDLEIILDYKKIKELVYKLVLTFADYNQVKDNELLDFLKQANEQIRIKDMSFEELKEAFDRIINNDKNKEYKEDEEKYITYENIETHENIEKIEEINKIKEINKIPEKMFPKKFVRIVVYGLEIEIEVYDTGTEYIPVEKYVSDDVIKQLQDLKEKERISNIVDMMERGNAGIYLDPETNEKVIEEIERRKRARQEDFNKNIEKGRAR